MNGPCGSRGISELEHPPTDIHLGLLGWQCGGGCNRGLVGDGMDVGAARGPFLATVNVPSRSDVSHLLKVHQNITL